MSIPKTANHEASKDQSQPEVETASKQIPKQKELYWLAGGIVIVVLVIISYKFGKQSVVQVQFQPSTLPLVQVSPTTNIDSMENWKTYTNNKYNYQIKYPSQDLVAHNCGNKTGLEGDEYFYIELKKWFGASWNPSILVNCQIVSINPGWILFVQQGIYKNILGKDYKAIQKNELVIGATTFTRYQYEKVTLEGFDERPLKVIHTTLYNPLNNKTFVFELNLPEDEHFFDQILSTFQFIYGSSETYSNSQYGFQFLYQKEDYQVNINSSNPYFLNQFPDHHQFIAEMDSSESTINIFAIDNIDLFKGMDPKVFEVRNRIYSDPNVRYTTEPISVSLYKGAKTEVYAGTTKHTLVTIVHPTKNLFIRFSIQNDFNNEFDQILSSFKFVE